MPNGAGWRSPSATDYLDCAQRPGFAWEFLRRDSDYREDYEQMTLHLARGTSTDHEVALALAQRWGLYFSVRSRTTKRSGADVVGPQHSARRGYSHRGAS